MNFKTGIFIIFLVIGLSGVPTCIYAQQYQFSPSDTVLQASLDATMDLNTLNPELRGGGGRSGGSSSSSASKTVKKLDGDDDDTGSDDGGSWWIVILILIIIIAIIAVWYFFLRK